MANKNYLLVLRFLKQEQKEFMLLINIKENESIEKETAQGNNKLLLDWLSNKIYQHGRYYTSEELCRQATGETLNSTHFINYATKKYSNIYHL